jgi:hypothetical protein
MIILTQYEFISTESLIQIRLILDFKNRINSIRMNEKVTHLNWFKKSKMDFTDMS